MQDVQRDRQRRCEVNLPTFTLASKSTATTYRFKVAEGSVDRSGWACCTVNDATGELSITSDWGNWAYRWNVQHLGRGSDQKVVTLTYFLSDRTSYDYLACKLCNRDEENQFDGDKTLAACREALLRARRNWMNTDERLWLRETHRFADDQEPLDKDLARQLWDEDLPSLCRDAECSGCPGDRFVEGFFGLNGAVWLTKEPWGLIRTSPSHAYLVLRDAILPALSAACGAEHAARTAPRAMQQEATAP